MGVDFLTAKTDMDLGLMRVVPHPAFPNGFPRVPIEEFEHLHEGDVGRDLWLPPRQSVVR